MTVDPKLRSTPSRPGAPSQAPRRLDSAELLAPKPAVPGAAAELAPAAEHGPASGNTLWERTTEVGGQTLKVAGEAARAVASEAGRVRGLSKVLPFAAPVALPSVGINAFRSLRLAAKERSSEAVNTAIGATAVAGSVGGESAKFAIGVASKSGLAAKVAEATGKTAPLTAGKAAGRLVPGLSIGIAAADVTWSVTVMRDKEASNTKKVLAGVSAGTSVVAAAASHIPAVGTAVAAGASAISAATLIASSFF